MSETASYRAIDAVVNIWTEEALSKRPGWGNDFFSGKMNADRGLIGNPLSLEAMIDQLDEAGIELAFLIAARSGRPGLPGCYQDASILLAPAISYDVLVQVMDAVRVYELPGSLGWARAELFPNISVGDAPT